MAEGAPRDVFRTTGDLHTLTSDTTRRVGLVSNEDVAPTLLRYFGIPIPSEMNGRPIRVVTDAGPPFALHRKHLENRRIGTPVGLMALGWVVLAGWRLHRAYNRSTRPASRNGSSLGPGQPVMLWSNFRSCRNSIGRF